MFLKNNLFIISNFFLIFLGIFFFNVDYKYSPDVESNIRDVKFSLIMTLILKFYSKD